MIATRIIPVYLLCIFLAGSVCSQQWSFAVISDSYRNDISFRKALHEIRDRTANSQPEITEAEFVVVNGDIGDIKKRLRRYNKVFGSDSLKALFYPVVGNHESRSQQNKIIHHVLPQLDSVVVRNNHTAHYYIDWNNARLILLDQYTDEAPPGCLGDEAAAWTAGCIATARRDTSIAHVFVFYHEPAFPRNRHIDDSFNECESLRNKFWRMLVDNRDMVRAVFNGHTHTYSRIKVANPESEDANNPHKFPQDINGIYQVDCGAAGQGNLVTVVRIQIAAGHITGRVVAAKKTRGGGFEEIDTWTFE